MTQVTFVVIYTLKLNMEDYLITISGFWIDTETGEVFAKFKFSKPLSSILSVDIMKYYNSFERGVRSGKNISVSLTISKDRDLPLVPSKVSQIEIF